MHNARSAWAAVFLVMLAGVFSPAHAQPQPYIGVGVQNIVGNLANALKMAPYNGSIVSGVVDGSPAQKAGLKVGDIIVSVNGQPVSERKNAAALVSEQLIGARVSVAILRNGAPQTITLIPVARPSNSDDQPLAPPVTHSSTAVQRSDPLEPVAGLKLVTLTPAIAAPFGIPVAVRGAIISSVAENSGAQEEGLERGDVILRIGSADTTDAATAAELLQAGFAREHALLVLVQRGRQPLFIGMTEHGEAALARQQLHARWGDLADLVGKQFVGKLLGSDTYVAFSAGRRDNHEAIVVFRSRYNEERGLIAKVYYDETRDRVKLDYMYANNIYISADGSFGFENIRYKLLPNGYLEVTWGKWREAGPTFEPHKLAEIWRPLSATEDERRIAGIRQAKASKGNSGLLGGLAFGIGAAFAGGNPEQVAGMAMKGVELTTDNENTRAAIAGQGDAFFAAGTQRRIENNGNHGNALNSPSNGSASTAQQNSAAASSSNPFGQAPSVGGGNASGAAGMPVQFYYSVGIAPGPNDTRNPRCHSEVVTLSETADLQSEEGRARARQLAEGYRQTFINRCSRVGSFQSGDVYLTVKGADSGWPPNFNPDDRQVMISN